MKKIVILFLNLLFMGTIIAAPSNTMSITTPTDGEVIEANDETTRYNEIVVKYNAHTHTDIDSLSSNTFTIGNNAVGNKTYAVSTDDTSDPGLRFNTADNIWQISMDGVTYKDLVSGYVLLDDDGSTAINAEQTSNDNKIRINIDGVETVILGDGTNEALAKFTNAGTATGLQLQQNGVLSATDYSLYVYSNAVQVNSPLSLHKLDNASSTATVMEVFNDGTGYTLRIDNNNTGEAISIDMDCNDDADQYAIDIDCDNAGSGAPGGIDFSDFSVDEPLLKVTADAITNAGTLAGQIAIDVGGVTYYLYYYQHGS